MTDTSVDSAGPTGGTHSLPEATWLWRRVSVFALGIAVYALLAFIVFKLATLGATAGLTTVAVLLICLQAWSHTVYLVSPTVEYVKAIGALIKDAKS